MSYIICSVYSYYIFFVARCYASAALAVCLYPSVCLSRSIYTQLYSPSKAATIKKTNKTKKKKRNKPLQDKSNTTGQHNSILGLIFSTQSTNDIIGYGEHAQKIKFSITYAHRRQRKSNHFHAAGRNFFGSSIEYFHECANIYIFQRLKSAVETGHASRP